MASWQSAAVTEMYRAWARDLEQPDPERQEPRETNDHWGDLTAEPRGVDYLEVAAATTSALWVQPHGAAHDRVLLYVHGGGFVGGSLFTHRKLVGHLAKAAGLRALLVTYPWAPEHRHPTQLDHVHVAYRWLLEEVGTDPRRLVVGGDSAAATLVLGNLVLARDAGLPLPAAGYLVSPWVDMTVSNESYDLNAGSDAYFHRPLVAMLAGMFLDGTAPTDPLASPAFADLTGLPPLYIQVGADETLLDDARNLHARAVRHGVDAHLDVFPEQQHTFQMAAGRAPEADDAVARFGRWVRPLVGLPGRREAEAAAP